MEPDSDSEAQSKMIRDAIWKLDKAMEGYKTITRESTVGWTETVFQLWTMEGTMAVRVGRRGATVLSML